MFDAGSTGFMLVCAMLVLLMTPGLAFFYGGLSRRKNVVNTMIMSFAVIGIVGVTWTVCGWSFAYGGDGSIPFFGGFDQIGLQEGHRERQEERARSRSGGRGLTHESDPRSGGRSISERQTKAPPDRTLT